MVFTSASVPDVSVVIPVYNRTAMLLRAVKSCLEQACAVEVIVVDDGSDDNVSTALTARFGPTARLQIVRQEKQGACVARNRGLDLATGEFVKFLDSDDELLPGALAQEIQAARRKGCDALLTGWEERTLRADGTEDLARRRTCSAPDLKNGIDDMLLGHGPWTSAALYRTKFVRPLRWNPVWTKAQDWGWALTVCLAGARFVSLDISSSIYVQHEGARITSEGHAVLRSTRARQALLKMVETQLLAQRTLTPERRRRLAQYYYRDAQMLAELAPAEWRRIWVHCRELVPEFRPDEPNRLVRWFCRLLGVRRGMTAYVRAKNRAKRLGLVGRNTKSPGRLPRIAPPATDENKQPE